MRFIIVLGFMYCLTVPVTAKTDMIESLHSVKQEIILLNLINGLYLTNEQMEVIADKIQQAELIRNEFKNDLLNKDSDIMNILEEAKTILNSGNILSEVQKQKIHKAERTYHTLEDEKNKQLSHLESELDAILNDNQKIIIQEYKPCLVPPKTGFIGQSTEATAEHFIHLLDRVRVMPHFRFERMKEIWVGKHLERMEIKEGVLSKQEKEIEKNKILQTFHDVRNLDDKSYLIKKAELARDFMPVHDKLKHRPKKYQPGKVGRFLLNRLLLPILKDRYGS